LCQKSGVSDFLPNAAIVMMKAHNWIRRAISKLEDLEDQEGAAATGTDG
jgi:hypothetical protein